MGVTGLWRLIEPAGKPVPVETLENKVLAVDISIWLHQMVKGYQDAKGAPIANAHLMGLFQRLCKLLYFRIKPIFVFDGAFPELKRETIAKRQDNKIKYNSESERLKRELALLLSKKTAISSILGKQISPKKSAGSSAQNDDDIFKLPALPQQEESESESEEDSSSSSNLDLHSVDVESESFKNLPVKEKYDLLLELKETRKQNSWGKLNELPKKSDNFSDFQMQRLLKRRKVQECLEETEKEMGDGGMSILELESLLNEEGIDTKIESIPTRRIAANNTTRFLLINNVKQALADAKKKETQEASSSKSEPNDLEIKAPKKDELESDIKKAIKMSLECNEADTSACTSKTDESWSTYHSDSDYSSDSEENDGYEPPDMSSAKAYIMQYSDFTDRAIEKIVSERTKTKTVKKKPILNDILEEINNEKSVIIDEVNLSSDEESLENDTDKTTDNVELDTTKQSSHNNGKDFDATQASVMVVDNPVEDIITLDSSLEDNAETQTNSDEIQSAAQIIPSKDLKVIHKVEDNKLTENISSKDEETHNVEESDSSDDFEEVSETEQSSKTVVELTLNMNDIDNDDDMFADCFDDKIVNKQISPFKKAIAYPDHSSTKPVLKSGLPANEVIQINDEDDELQKAIQMSLECVTEEADSIANIPSKIETLPTEIAREQDSISQSVDSISKPSGPGPRIASTSTKSTENHNIIEDITNEPSKKVNKPTKPLSTEKLNNIVEEINTEEQNLMQEKGKLDRIGRNITEQMTKDAQELLQLFGIPYIVAPMEAEAQCAFLESVNLTDGTITDDSDIWLFGGRTVYKNFFNQKKHVLQFLSDRIERSFNLNREQLILLALLVGSDYTTGVAGVGPVTALEILASFPFSRKKLLSDTSKQDKYAQVLAGLQEFKQWVRNGKRTDNTSLKKKLRNVDLGDDFPSMRVVQAYLEPNVEKSEERFTWGEIDITILRDYTKAKFGWSQHKTDEILKPVLKRLTERKNQKSVQDYFKKKVDFQSLEEHMSKRVKAAVQKMGPDTPMEERVQEENVAQLEKKRKARGKKMDTEAGPSKPKQKKTEDVLKEHSVKVVSEIKDGKSEFNIQIRKTDRFQEIIPQREKDKQSLLQNKLKAIELFRKTNIDKKKKLTKRKPIIPKADAELSESDSD